MFLESDRILNLLICPRAIVLKIYVENNIIIIVSLINKNLSQLNILEVFASK